MGTFVYQGFLAFTKVLVQNGYQSGYQENEMAREKLLSEAKCKSAKPTDRLFYLNDGGGLRLRVRPNGSRHWIFRYRVNDKERSSSMGAYPQVSLKDARMRAAAAKSQVQEGYDPVVAKRVFKAQIQRDTEHLFKSVAMTWLKHNHESWSPHHYERNSGLVRRYLLPDLGDLPIESIEEAYLFNVLKRVYDSGIRESARRARAVAAQIFSYGRATHVCSKNPAKDMADNPYFKKPPVKHHTAIPQHEVPELIKCLSERGEEQLLQLTTIGGLLMALYTGLRDSSIRGARWSEIDFDKGLWTVPAIRMKSRREHIVPLPSQASLILKELEPLTFRGPDSYVFASNSKQGFISENTLRMALHRIGFKVTVHGMRSLSTDVLSENSFNRDWIEKQMDHQERNQVRAAYLRTKFLEQRTTMMQWFADWCDASSIEANTKNVIKMSARDER